MDRMRCRRGAGIAILLVAYFRAGGWGQAFFFRCWLQHVDSSTHKAAISQTEMFTSN
jgi:hypothetical protein